MWTHRDALEAVADFLDRAGLPGQFCDVDKVGMAKNIGRRTARARRVRRKAIRTAFRRAWKVCRRAGWGLRGGFMNCA